MLFAALLLQVALIAGQTNPAPASSVPLTAHTAALASPETLGLQTSEPTSGLSLRDSVDIVKGVGEGVVVDTAVGLWDAAKGGAWVITHPVKSWNAVQSAALVAGSAVKAGGTALIEHPVDTTVGAAVSTYNATGSALTAAGNAWSAASPEDKGRLIGDGLSLLIPYGGEASLAAKAGKAGEALTAVAKAESLTNAAVDASKIGDATTALAPSLAKTGAKLEEPSTALAKSTTPIVESTAQAGNLTAHEVINQAEEMLTKAGVGPPGASTSAAMNTPGSGTILWAGGDASKLAAQQFALDTGRSTLEMTPAGKALVEETQGMPWGQAEPKWITGSQRYATDVNGTVHVFLNGDAGVRPGAILLEHELPLIADAAKAGKITGIQYHIVKDGKVVQLINRPVSLVH